MTYTKKAIAVARTSYGRTQQKKGENSITIATTCVMTKDELIYHASMCDKQSIGLIIITVTTGEHRPDVLLKQF